MRRQSEETLKKSKAQSADWAFFRAAMGLAQSAVALDYTVTTAFSEGLTLWGAIGTVSGEGLALWGAV
jgi:hypothetical protein